MLESLLLLLVCVGLAAVSFYLGFIKEKTPRESTVYYGRAQFSFIVFSVISVVSMWHVWNLTQMESRLSKYAVPYPGAQYTVSYSSFVDDNARWLATVNASPDAVMAFYLSPQNVPGWTVVEESEYGLVFRKDTAQLVIFVNHKGLRGSGITYILTKQK